MSDPTVRPMPTITISDETLHESLSALGMMSAKYMELHDMTGGKQFFQDYERAKAAYDELLKAQAGSEE